MSKKVVVAEKGRSLSSSYPRPTLMKKNLLSSSQRYVPLLILGSQKNICGHIQATIHQSIPTHPNIVTFYRTLETSAFLFLLLEFVPGQNLSYFLEQARDRYDVDPASDLPLNRTPPTPGLLSSFHPSQLLSSIRLRLIAYMFAQMCEAVATCHDASVFHRGIEPENFIVTDGWSVNQDGIHERKVVVKLCDFGFSTCDAVSSDMDCGSVPYMSFGTPLFSILFTSLAYLSSQNAETTWLLCTSPVLRMYGLSALSSSTCTLPPSCFLLLLFLLVAYLLSPPGFFTTPHVGMWLNVHVLSHHSS